METQQIQAIITDLERQRDQALLNLGGLNGQLKVWRDFLAVSQQGESNAVGGPDAAE